MNRRTVPRQHRRYSLPSTPTQPPLGFARSIPEGSDVFQKALEDLYTNEPNHAPPKFDNAHDFGFNGLNNIQEQNESDYEECDDNGGNDVTDGLLHEVRASPARRHSSPCFPGTEHQSGVLTDSKPEITKESIMAQHNRLRKEYFKKHGHWPMSNGKPMVNRSRPASYHRVDSSFGPRQQTKAVK